MAVIDLGASGFDDGVGSVDITTSAVNRAVLVLNHSMMSLRVTLSDNQTVTEVPTQPFTLGPSESFVFLVPSSGSEVTANVVAQHTLVGRNSVPPHPTGLDDNYPAANAQFFLTQI